MSWKKAVLILVGVTALLVLIVAVRRLYTGLPEGEVKAEPPDCFVSPLKHPETYHKRINISDGVPWLCDSYKQQSFCYRMKPTSGTCHDLVNSIIEQDHVDEVKNNKLRAKEEEEAYADRMARRNAMWDILRELNDIKRGKVKKP